MIAWWWTILAASLGCTLGVFLMGWLNASGPNADEAIWHLGQLYRLIVHRRDAEVFPPGGVLDNARRFLLRYGDGEQGA